MLSMFLKQSTILLILAVSGGPLSSKYKFEQFHFHWGGNDKEGSEHRVDGKMYPAEVGTKHEISNPIWFWIYKAMGI